MRKFSRIRHLYSAVLVGLVGVGLVILFQNGVLAELWHQDTLYICTATVFVAMFCFVASFSDPKLADDGIDICTSLGFLGTVIGFIIMINALDEGSDVWSMRSGLAIAVYTTAVGLVCALVLKLQQKAVQREFKANA